MNDRFLMRGTLGIAYELMWANPYQPGLSYYHVPLVAHDAIGGELFVRSSWEDDARGWVFSADSCSCLANGEVARVDPACRARTDGSGGSRGVFRAWATKFEVPEPRSRELR